MRNQEQNQGMSKIRQVSRLSHIVNFDLLFLKFSLQNPTHVKLLVQCFKSLN